MWQTLLNNVQRPEVLPGLLLALILTTTFLLVTVVLQAFQVRRLHRRLHTLTRGTDGQNLEETLRACMDRVDAADRRMELMEQAIGVLQAQVPLCLQRAGLVRYDAFEDIGGEQSFSLALLNGQGDGLVLSGVHSRNDVRVYAKEIRQGRSSHGLSDEEKRALQACYQ